MPRSVDKVQTAIAIEVYGFVLAQRDGVNVETNFSQLAFSPRLLIQLAVGLRWSARGQWRLEAMTHDQRGRLWKASRVSSVILRTSATEAEPSSRALTD